MNLLVSPVRPGGARHVGAVQGRPRVGGRAAAHRIYVYQRYHRYQIQRFIYVYITDTIDTINTTDTTDTIDTIDMYHKYHRYHIKIIYLRM